MNFRKLSILGAIALGIGFQTTVNAAQAPNYYNCTGKHVSVALTIGGKAEVGILPPKTMLNLQIGKKSYDFQEADITTEPTLIGDLKEVILEIRPDVNVKHASVVIPSISLGSTPVKFQSQLILTTVATPFINKAFEGVVNSSKYIDLACTASMVYY
ncbi:MAG: hypothetical protein PHE55_13115 [Methylococcaceae bacterium]|nr:hypothetical protein [Methylococcaceae bacterium]